ncbi:MAG: DUF4397 domain-containing protein [Acidimicrobiia bacterium]|nr:DUF4397 domain-containing protein [Acidimicrobiia bacterium]
MNTHDETTEDSITTSVNGFDEIVVADEGTAVKVTVGSPERWDRSHLRRLRQSADLPGLVPVIDSDFASDGTPFAVTPVIDDPTLASMIPPAGPAWQDCAAITEAAARATHEAHLRGLFHGALSPDQIYVVGDDVAVAGIGLGLGGEARPDYHHWVAPEVLDGIDATERSDVYSLGKILEASLGDSLEDVPRSVRRLIMWSGSDTPEARPPSALEFASILAEALGDDRKTYSPAFIPTAEANTLAATASGIVAAHTPTSSSSRASGLAAGGAAIGAAAVASQLAGDAPDTIEVADGVEITPDGVEIEAPIEEVGVVDNDDDILVGDSGVDVIDDETDLDETDLDETDLDETEAEHVGEPAEELDGVGEDAVITGEVEIDEEAAALAAAAETSQLEDIGEGGTLLEDDEAAFDSREYSKGITEAATETADDYEVPAAQTVELDPTYGDDSRGNRAGILVGAILAGGLALIAWGLLRSGDEGFDHSTTGTTVAPVADEAAGADTENSDTEANTTTDAEPSAPVAGADEATESNTSETATGTESEETTDTSAETEEQTTTSTTEATTTSTEAPASEESVVEAETSVPIVNGPVSADEAGIQIVHGVPGADVDVYVDGEAIIPGFTAGTIAGPIALDAGSHVVDLYQAVDGAPAAAGDRTDLPITSQSVTVGSDPASLIAHLDGNGEVLLSSFAENLAPTDPAQGRIVVRHLAQGPEVTVNVDGEPVPDGTIGNGEFATIPLAAGQHTVSAVTDDGTEVANASITVEDGELASITVFGSAEAGTLDAVVQSFSGLSSAPTEVPTGNSNLLGMDEDMTSLYLVGLTTLVMVIAGGAVMARRRRIL